MNRGWIDAFTHELAGVSATGLTFLLAFAVGRLTGARPEEPLGPDPRAESGTSPSAEVASAELARRPVEKPRRKLNVVLITVDTLRADLGFSGYPRPVTPNIDAFAAKSVVYEHAYAMASFTPKCLGPLLIGKYVSETERDYQHYTNFGPANVFLAERVQAGGGHTLGAATHRYFGWKKGFDQGFDVWDTSAIPPNSVDNDPTITSGTLTDLAIRWLSSDRASEIPRSKTIPAGRSGPAEGHFFAWFHYLDPHLPYVPQKDAPNFAAMRAEGVPRERAPYDAEVWYTDQQIGRLLQHIASQPWASETAIILTADHGEAFGEHAHWGHGRELWEPLVHVPFIVHVPGTPPRRIATRRSHVDVVPTVLELMNLPSDPSLRGKSLVADLAATAAENLEERDVYIDMPEGPYNEMRRAIVYGPSPGMKLIDFGGTRHALYDLSTDPQESKSLAGDRTRLGEAMAKMAQMRAAIPELPAK